MARTAAETARILTDLYDEQFNRESSEPFRITWPQLRHLAEASLLNDSYLNAVNKVLSDSDYNLIPLNHFLAVVMDQDMASYRMLPDKVLEKCLFEFEDIELGDCDLDEEDEDDEEDLADENEDQGHITIEEAEI